ncbi:anthranilate phosphoribosyltransferase [Kordiimonas sp. SCSIO 12610]|uniref:anthranilate phosphoribosyltransferase n=1 Tax=Kordiimonas sp. SCSIO 12610 TaxID=2829597 RepID=UPI00210C14D3|nr:anthranilate phosphoribosyltransferase [Kordiimonas sp. SCSIO 12610]UTW54039.1 anthranilate phosphoribosyltransferase [Kordiimonas sp. SCSIO 12610]
MSDFVSILSKVATGAYLNQVEARSAFETIMSGGASTEQTAAFLMGLRVRGEHVDEITAGAEVMRAKASHINAPINSVDTCGTGGTGISTYNISTASAFVTVAAGIPVAKHGNRAASSKSGSADVLEALGAKLEISMEAVQRSLDETGFSFLFARAHHSAMRFVAPVRTSIKVQTIFNLLGPLSNPAQAKRQILGVFDPKWQRPMAEVLKNLGSEHVWVVHGEDGMDEITTTGKTHIVELKNGQISEFDITPEDVGLTRATLEDLKGDDAEYNAAAITMLFDGKKSAFRDIVLMNTGAALLVGNKVQSLQDGVTMAASIIDSGKAKAKLAEWVEFTQTHS